MRKENLWLLINTVILILVGAVVLLVYSNVPTNKEDKLFDQNVTTKKIQDFMPPSGDRYESLILAKRASVGKKEIGRIYEAEAKNAYGIIRILIGITNEDIVTVEPLVLDQTSSFISEIKAYIYGEINGKYYDTMQDIDLVTGATDTKGMASRASIKNLIILALEHKGHSFVPYDPLLEWYGEGYTAELIDGLTTAELKEAHQVLDASQAVIGAVYKLSVRAQYNDGGSEGSITLLVGLDQDQKIIGIYLPTDVYEHSPGGFYNTAVKYAESFIGSNISALDGNTDLTSGATYSSGIVTFLLGKLAGVLE
mgnify:CR=1 FL=1